MKGFLLSIFVFFAVLATAYGLKCYYCEGEGDKCAKDNLGSGQERTCPSGLDKCMRVWRKKDDVTSIYSTCTKEATCKAEEDLCDGECAVGCCDTDLCNAGSPVSLSVFLAIVCSALGLGRVQ